jgi:hypothetical protein
LGRQTCRMNSGFGWLGRGLEAAPDNRAAKSPD